MSQLIGDILIVWMMIYIHFAYLWPYTRVLVELNAITLICA